MVNAFEHTDLLASDMLMANAYSFSRDIHTQPHESRLADNILASASCNGQTMPWNCEQLSSTYVAPMVSP